MAAGQLSQPYHMQQIIYSVYTINSQISASLTKCQLHISAPAIGRNLK